MKFTKLFLLFFLQALNLFAQPTNSLSEKNKLKKLYIDSVSNGNTIPNFNLMDLNGDTLNFHSLLGKTIIIDIWATWCAPCLKESPYFDSIQSNLNNDSIVFMSISIDSNFSKWKTHSLNKTSPAQQYWIGDNENSPIYWLTYESKEINEAIRIISGVPRFIIIDSNGVIKSKDASPPSSGLLVNEILE
jgi:thiol-disulfide isomerase/thioredoxin